MNILNKKKSAILFLGDLCILTISLYLSLLIRFKQLPNLEVFNSHFFPFAILFLIWTVSYFIAGLYETHRVIIRNKLPEILIKTQVVNSVIAVTFFYFLPFFGITPKTILSVFIVVSLLAICIWRIGALYLFRSNNKQKAILIGSGEDAEDLFLDINKITWLNFEFISRINPDSFSQSGFFEHMLEKVKEDTIEIIVIDTSDERLNKILPLLYSTFFSKIQFIDFQKLYGEIFYKMPVDKLSYSWFIQYISLSKYSIYDFLKRLMDILITLVFCILAIPFVLCAALVIKFQDFGPIFSIQTRVGRFGKLIKVIKLRTMLFNDHGDWKSQGKENKVTRFGTFLRKTRIDELPQLINVLKGDVSLIGPRPEFPQAVEEYKKTIAYYDVRHIIKPGLSGWAQIYHDAHPHHGIDIEQTKQKLSYDLFYIKNRSIVLDLMIALKTIKTFLSREGK